MDQMIDGLEARFSPTNAVLMFSPSEENFPGALTHRPPSPNPYTLLRDLVGFTTLLCSAEHEGVRLSKLSVGANL